MNEQHFELRREGVLILEGDWLYCMSYIHDTHAFSLEHALKYEGYSIKTVDDELTRQAKEEWAKEREYRREEEEHREARL